MIMNTKIKLLTITLASLLSYALVGCGNSSTKQQTETTVQQKNLLEDIFKETFAKKESFFELIRKDAVKERIISEYSQNFYDKLCQQIQVSSSISYTDGKYEGNGTGGRYGNGEAYLSYIPANDILTINFTIGRRTIQRDGEVYYNTEGWEVKYPKDEFDEDITSEPVLMYELFENDGLITYSPIWLSITPVRVKGGIGIGCIFCTNKLGYSSSNIAKILVKDNASGRVYNIAFDEPYYEEYSGFKYADVGVGIFNDTFIQFMNTITGLVDCTISFINEDGENAVIKNPENLCNIRDAFDKFMEDYKKME